MACALSTHTWSSCDTQQLTLKHGAVERCVGCKQGDEKWFVVLFIMTTTPHPLDFNIYFM